MKLITFAVPSYNSESYLSTCIDSLLVGGEDVEIIIVNDGSKDRTKEIADDYVSRYPTIVRAVHKENGGHGSGVNKGLELATGLFFKVVDSDDWLDAESLKKMVATIKEHVESGETADLYIANFVYEHMGDHTQHISEYRKEIPVGRFFSWEESKPLHLWKMFLMHSIICRTEMLRKANITLPHHTFYVDNVFAYLALPLAKKLFYLDVDLYRYLIGRAGQSVLIENLVGRYEQQIRCMSLMLQAVSYEQMEKLNKPLQKQLYHFLDCTLMNTYFFTTAKDTPERRAALAGMWNELKERDPKLYKRVQRFPKMILLNCLWWKAKGFVTTFSYKFLCKHVKLGM